MLFDELAVQAKRHTVIIALILFTSLAAAQLPENPHQVQGQFTRTKAMRVVYGNYSPKSATSTVADLSDYAPQLGKVVGLVRVASDVAYSENGVNYRLLVTYAVPRDENFKCHPCAPSVSAFLFEQHGNQWLLKNARYDLPVGGSLGQPTALKLIEIGNSRHGLIARSSYVAQGDVTEEVTIFVPRGDSFPEVFNISTVSDNLANCQIRKVECSRQTAAYRFVRGSGKEVWDIRITEREVVNGKIVAAAKTSTYEFTNGKYEMKR